MNYAGSEEVRKDLEKLTEALYEVYRQAAEFESRFDILPALKDEDSYRI
ncbi:hypothetical protein OTV55_004439 [Salmonella enterica]|nr:hypothetical protein [Salmonella enterica]